MKYFIPLLMLGALGLNSTAQTYSGSGGSIIQLVDTSRFNIVVSGLTPANIDSSFGLISVTININHGTDRDIDCFIASPDGSMIELTTDNGGTGNNYTNTVFRYDAPTSITNGSAPFTGNYIPEGDIWRLNNGQDGNGTWQLRVIDDALNASSGTLVNWSVTFGPNPPQPFSISESNLPIVIINTGGQTIPDDPKIIADMGIIDNGFGNRNHVSDPMNGYNGKIGIEIRGSSSQMFPKKSYGFETRSSVDTSLDTNVVLLGMPSEHDWVLSANYSDKTFLHNFLTYQLQREIGHWAPRCQYVDVILDGKYIGIYILMESVKWDDSRVDINHLRSNENSYPEITGGYIIKIDKQTGSGGAGWTSAYPPINNPNGQTIYYQYDYPDPDSISVPQQNYIQAYVDSFEDALFGPDYMDSVLGYKNFIGDKSFIDYFFSNEVSKNVDGYRISTYLYKDRNKTLKAGPAWDYDIAYGNANYCGGDDTLNWAYLFPCTGDYYQIPAWWPRMLTDSNFTNQLKCRWNQLRESSFSNSHLYSVIDSVAAYIDESQGWNFMVWPILGVYVWPNVAPYPPTYAGEIANLKQWLGRRMQWLDDNLPGNCNCNLTVSAVDASCSATCDGQAIALGSSDYPITYTWDNGAPSDSLTGLCVGSYSIVMEDAVGCIRTDTVTINSPATFTLSGSTTPSICGQCNGSASIQVNGASGPVSIQWNTGDTATAIINLCPGNYSVVVTDTSGCGVLQSLIVGGNPAVTTSETSSNVLCNGNCTGAAGITVNTGTGPYTYSWQPGGFTTASVSNLCAGSYVVLTTDANGCTETDSITIAEPSALVASLNAVSNPLCNGSSDGSASVAVNGGSVPYNYSWSPSGGTSAAASNLPAGIYTVIVTDNNSCADTVLITVTEPPAITLFTSFTSASCGVSNGTATCTPSGGVPPYTYLWSPSGGTASTATNIPAGTYSVTVTDSNNCAQTAFVTVPNANAPTVTIQSIIDVACNGDSSGSASVSVSGGTPPFTYSWSPTGGNNASAVNLFAGNYTVTVTDANNCVTTQNLTVNEPDGLQLTVQGVNVTCFGNCDGGASAVVTGGVGGYSYLWCNGNTNSVVFGLCPGTCQVQVTDSNNCIISNSVTITEPASALAVAITHNDASCAGCANGWASANASGGTGPYSYVWNTVPQQTTALATGLLPGTYVVCITDADNCTVCDSVEILDGSIGINEITLRSSPVYVYPNPTSQFTNFIFSLSRRQHVLLQVFDMRGKLVRELINEVRNGGDHIQKLDAADLGEGVYHYHFRTDERVQDGSLVIQR